MSKRIYHKGGKVDVWQGMDKSWCVQAIHRDNAILTKAGFTSPTSAKSAGKQAIDKAVEFGNHTFKIF